MSCPDERPIVDFVAGARPNFVKLAALVRAFRGHEALRARIVHTGQHYDDGMTVLFLDELDIPAPDVNLDVGSGTHGAQTARILERYEALLLERRPAATVVLGDVNSTVACALAAAKLSVPVVHVEAGLRSFDRRMPEELNRILTDSISDLLLVSEPSGLTNLAREGIDAGKVALVGNVMIDTLAWCLPRARARRAFEKFGLEAGGYGLVTMHRPSNVDDPVVLDRLLRTIALLSEKLPLVFPVHPRTSAAAAGAGLGALIESRPGLQAVPPLSYLDNLGLMASARVVLTDSGGIQEESTALGVPCVTLRDCTERPITVERGTSVLVGTDPLAIRDAFVRAVDGSGSIREVLPIPSWDGHAADRACERIVSMLCG